MFHAHIISFVTCFICILLHLFTFSWTNLLTRCPVPISCFLLFFVSENLHRKYSRNCTGRKPSLLFSRHAHGVQRGEGGEPRPLHTMWWRGQRCHDPSTPSGGAAPPLATSGSGEGPTGASDQRTSAYLFPRCENPKTIDVFHERVPPRCRH